MLLMTPYEYKIFLKVCFHSLSVGHATYPIVADQSLPDHLPQVSTLRILFSRHLDISAVPKRSFFRLLKYFATDEREREKLEEFSSPEGAVNCFTPSRRSSTHRRQGELYEYTTRVRRTILEVLNEFRSVHVPREHIFELFPPLRPREFSIASASLAHPHEIHLCVAVVDYKTKLRALRRGLCTSFLASLPIGTWAFLFPVAILLNT
jgi:sulfite reductase alpha subunit-like flavoprotein